jgi:hypothetical protein
VCPNKAKANRSNRHRSRNPFLCLCRLGFQGFHIEQVHVLHVSLQALRALAGVANGPYRLVDFAQDVFDHGFVHAFDFLQLVVLDQLGTEAQFLRQLVHDHVIRAAFPQRFNHLFTPLDRAVRGCARAAGFKLRRGGQQVDRAIGVEVLGFAGHGCHGCCGRRVRIDHHQQVELVHGTLHLQTSGLRVGRVPPIKHGLEVAVLINQLVFLEHTVDPTRHRHAGFAHHAGVGKTTFEPIEFHTPSFRKVLPRAFDQAVIAWQ